MLIHFISKFTYLILNYIKIGKFILISIIYIYIYIYIFSYLFIYIYSKISKYIMFYDVYLPFSLFKFLLRCWGIVSKQKSHALTFCRDLSNFQPVNFHLIPFRAFLDVVCTKTTRA